MFQNLRVMGCCIFITSNIGIKTWVFVIVDVVGMESCMGIMFWVMTLALSYLRAWGISSYMGLCCDSNFFLFAPIIFFQNLPYCNNSSNCVKMLQTSIEDACDELSPGIMSLSILGTVLGAIWNGTWYSVLIVVCYKFLVQWSTNVIFVILHCTVLYELRLSLLGCLCLCLYYIHSITHH